MTEIRNNNDQREDTDEKKYRVVQYVDQWPVGQTRFVLAESLTFDEAVQCANKNDAGVASEALVIEDQLDPGWSFDVKSVGKGATRENPLKT